MSSNIMNIGQSALAAAQAGISTAGHNIANASTPGYSRQTVIQTTAIPQSFGYGFIGHGTQVSSVQRIYSSFLGNLVNTSQAASSQFSTYTTQINQIDNLLADDSAGLSPALQDFFNAVQSMASNPSSASERQSFLSGAQSLVTRFNSLGNRLDEIGTGVNDQIGSAVSSINSLGQQLAKLNDSISKLQNGTGQPPNDLLDQRDQLINELSKQTNVSVVKQDGDQYNVFIGSGLPLVVGANAYAFKTTPSLTDPTRTEVAYAGNNQGVILGENSLTGGTLGALLNFRSETLDPAKNALGRVAIAVTSALNDQNHLGQDLNGQPGGDIFQPVTPDVGASRLNSGNGIVAASISNANVLTTSDYSLKYDGVNYTVTRLDDGVTTSSTSLPQTVDGVQISLTSGAMAAGDEYTIRPTANVASSLSVSLTDINKIAAAAPVLTAQVSTNTGSGVISAGAVGTTYLGSPLGSTLTLSYNSGTQTFSGFPATQAVTVTLNGSSTTYAAGAAVPYSSGATYSFGGISFTLSGTPANGDSFTVGPNTGGIGDGRNALLMAALQTQNTMAGGTTTYQGAYAQLVSQVGNKAHEVQTNSATSDKLLSDAQNSQQSLSGVNLDEEAADLLRYQQAYQAAGKVMQIASSMFDTLLQIGT